MLDAQGQPITEIYASIPTSVPPPPPGDAIMVYYDFGPAGATFNPPLTMTLAYDPVTIPAGVPETSLFIAFYDTTTGQWVVLPGSVVNPVTHTVTAPTSHFTLFSVMSPRSTTATPTTTSAPNWALIMVIIIVVVVVGLLIFFLMVGRRRRKKE